MNGHLTGAEELNRSAHTPGPWEAEAKRNWLQAIVVATATKKIVARISTRETFGVGDEELADARLIAAAPELLKTLVAITDQLECIGDSRKDAPFIEAARAAIAKATGAPQ